MMRPPAAPLALFGLACLLLAGCDAAPPSPPAPSGADFPTVRRPVAQIVSDRWSDEASREEAKEAETVMNRIGVKAGDVVGDIGAGTGYYTLKLARRVGPGGHVYAEDILPKSVDTLRLRVGQAGLANVSIVLGDPDDPGLPPRRLDYALLAHMYHEVDSPYALLWHLRDSLKPKAVLAVVDADRPTERHGTPLTLLDCELEAVGFTRFVSHLIDDEGHYVALYRTARPRPAADRIRPCPLSQ